MATASSTALKRFIALLFLSLGQSFLDFHLPQTLTHKADTPTAAVGDGWSRQNLAASVSVARRLFGGGQSGGEIARKGARKGAAVRQAFPAVLRRGRRKLRRNPAGRPVWKANTRAGQAKPPVPPRRKHRGEKKELVKKAPLTSGSPQIAMGKPGCCAGRSSGSRLTQQDVWIT